MLLGAHIGISEGMAEAAATAREIGCDTIQIFSKSPQMWKGPPIADEQAAAFREAVAANKLRKTAVHHGYLINLASPKPPALRMSRMTFVDELQRAEKVGVDYLIFHPGAHLGSGQETGLATIVESLNWAFEQTAGFRVRALLENAAGQGTALCSTLGELEEILRKLVDPGRAGVALDTCHLFGAGNDFRDDAGYRDLMERIAGTVGRKSVFAFHLNDAKAELGSHLDRHENIGKGKIGVAGFEQLVNDPDWKETPGYLETPLDSDDYARYREDLSTLRALIRERRPGRTKGGPAARRKAKSPT